MVAGDATMRVYKWVPVSSDKPGARAKSLLSASACLSAGNKENVASVVAMATEEDSNTGILILIRYVCPVIKSQYVLQYFVC